MYQHVEFFYRASYTATPEAYVMFLFLATRGPLALGSAQNFNVVSMLSACSLRGVFGCCLSVGHIFSVPRFFMWCCQTKVTMQARFTHWRLGGTNVDTFCKSFQCCGQCLTLPSNVMVGWYSTASTFNPRNQTMTFHDLSNSIHKGQPVDFASKHTIPLYSKHSMYGIFTHIGVVEKGSM